MDLKHFISETLAQIAEGVAAAEPRVREAGGIPNPSLGPSQRNPSASDYFGALDNGRAVFLVSFDVGISVQEKAGIEGGGELRIAAVFRAGGKASDTTETETVNRVRFSVPFALPEDPDTTRSIERRQARQEESMRRHNQGGGWQSA